MESDNFEIFFTLKKRVEHIKNREAPTGKGNKPVKAKSKGTRKKDVKSVKAERMPALDLSNITYLDPKVDLTFKRIFADHPDLLINFLNAVMPLPADRPIVEIEYLPSELMPSTPTKKYSIVDVRCKDKLKRQFIIEMQMFWNSEFYNRIVFNASKAYVKQLDQGDEYHLLQPVYTLALINEDFSKSKSYYHHYQIINREDTGEVIHGLEFVIVELTDKFYAETMAERKLMILWLRFLKETNEKLKELPDELQKNKHISKAAELCESAAFTHEELLKYNAEKEYIRIERALIEGAKRDALAEGEAIGEEKATKKFEGILAQRDKDLAQRDINFVINTHNAGISVEDIAKYTGLSIEKVTQIIKTDK